MTVGGSPKAFTSSLAFNPMSAPFGSDDVDRVHSARGTGGEIGGEDSREKGHHETVKVIRETPGDQDVGDFDDPRGAHFDRLKVKADQRSQGHPAQGPE